jgi:ankyrin repeat protein
MDWVGIQTLLDLAGHGDIERVRKHVEDHRAHFNATTSYGTAALQIAAEHGHLEIVQYLAACGANVNATVKASALLACREGCFACQRGLFCQQACDRSLSTVLMLAAQHGHLEKVRGVTALMEAASGGHLEIVQYLVEERGADVNAVTIDGYTALTVACASEHETVAGYFLGFAERQAAAAEADLLAEESKEQKARPRRRRKKKQPPDPILMDLRRSQSDVMLADDCCENEADTASATEEVITGVKDYDPTLDGVAATSGFRV